MRHLISSQDIDRAGYDELFRRSEKFWTEGIPPDLCKNKVAATLFFQPSTRTMLAFQSGMIQAGGGWVGVMGEQGISMEKGESFEDTIRTFSEFAHCIVLRHLGDDSAARAAAVSHVPVINGGSGSREHAVAAVMLLFEYYHLFKKLAGLKIGIYGTPGINRCVKAMLPIMGYYGMRVVIDDLEIFPVPEDVAAKAKQNGLRELTYDRLDNFIGDVDVLVCTRGLQKGIIPPEKFSQEKEAEVLAKYKPISVEHMKRLRQDAYLSMILPRIFEIDRAVDSDPRALYSKREPFTETCLATMTYLLEMTV